MIVWGWILSIVGGLGSLISGIIYMVEKDDYENRAYSFYSNSHSNMEIAQICLFVFLAVLVVGVILLIVGYVSKEKRETAMRTERVMQQLMYNRGSVPPSMQMQSPIQPSEPSLSEQETSKGCPNCGFRNNNMAKFCNKCGYEFGARAARTTKRCKSCGFENDLNASYCRNCDQKL